MRDGETETETDHPTDRQTDRQTEKEATRAEGGSRRERGGVGGGVEGEGQQR